MSDPGQRRGLGGPKTSPVPPWVSVIICAYNVEKYLQQAIDSVLEQTHRRLQLVVVDDASTDGTNAIATKAADDDPRVLVVRRERNGGLAHARMSGIDAASHEIIVFLDGDDMVLPGMVEEQLGVLSRDDSILGVATYAAYILDDEAKVMGTKQIGPITKEDSLRMFRERKLMFLLASTMTRKSDIFAAGGFRLTGFPTDEGIRYQDYCDDLDLWCRMADQGAQGRYFITIPRALYLYRKSASTLSGNTFAMQAKMRWIKDCMVRRRAGLPERSFEEHRDAAPLLRRLNNLRKDIAAVTFKRAAFCLLRRQRVQAAVFAGVTCLLSPKLVLQNLAVQKRNRPVR